MNVLQSTMSMVRVTGNYQVTIPASIRKALRVNIGDFMSVALDAANGVLIKPIEVKERLLQTTPQDAEDKDWKQTGAKAMFSQYNTKDSAYDAIKL